MWKLYATFRFMKNLPKPFGRSPFAVTLLEPEPQDRILNVGCFNGALEYYYLQGKVEDFQGIDVNEEAIRLARDWCSRALGSPDHFKVAGAEEIPYPDESFDKVLCLDVFEHVNDEKKTVSEIYRILKPGGVLVLSVPHDFLNFLDPDELTRGFRNFVRRYIRPRPLLDHPRHRHYSEDDLKAFFSKFKFEVVHKSGTPLFWILAMIYGGIGLPAQVVQPLSKMTAFLENWDYQTSLKTGFNIMIKMRKI